jgi:DNA-binding SARP family transcriptional activator
MAVIEIALLGRFAVTVDGRPVPDSAWRRKRAAGLVKILALAEGRRLHREQVMDLLWPGLPAAAASANLRKAVHYARAALGAASAIGRCGAMLELCPAGDLRVDAQAFEAAARAGQSGAAGLYHGDLLPEDRYAPWAEEPREQLRALYLRLLKAAQQWERVLEADPADEQAHRALMQRAIQAGDRQAVIRQFGRLCDRLRADLGVGPDRQTVQVYEQALVMEPAGAAERAGALLANSLLQLNAGDLDQAEQTAEQARTLALRTGLGLEAGRASAVLGITASQRGQWKQRFRAEFSAALRLDPATAAYILDAHMCLAEGCLYGPAGHEQFTGYASELLATARQAGSIQGQALAELLLGEAEALSGHLGAAQHLLASAVALHEQAGATSRQAAAMHRLAQAALAGGQRARATWLLQRSLSLADQSWLRPHLAARIHGTLVAAAANPQAAVRRVQHADRALARHAVCQPCSTGFLVAAATACARAGHLDQAQHRLLAAERLAGMWSAGSWNAAVWEARAELRQAEGDTTRAAALFAEAADQYAQLGRPLDRDRCRAAARRAADKNGHASRERRC